MRQLADKTARAIWCSEQQLIAIMMTEKEVDWVRAKEMSVIVPLLTKHKDNLFVPYVSYWYKPLTSQICVKSLTGLISIQMIRRLSPTRTNTIWSCIALPFIQGQHIWIP